MTKAAPKARELAKELGLEIADIAGTGKGGFIKVIDVEVHAGLAKPEEAAQVFEAPQAPVAAPRERVEEFRGTLNHGKDNDVEIGGMRFKKPDSGALDHSTSKRLDIPKKYLNNELHYHWATDDGGRVEQLRERKGYAMVPDIKTESGDTITTRRLTGVNKDGSPQYQQLMATPNQFYGDRKKKTEDGRRFKEQGIVENPTDENGKPLDSNEFYMPAGSSIGRK